MRLAIIGGSACAAVIIVLVAVPSQGSPSCMTQAEARTKFATSHLYWHGAGHCWDATPPRQRLVQRVRPVVDREAQDADEQPGKVESKKPEPKTQESNTPESKFRNAMSEMVPGDASAAVPAMRVPPVLPQPQTSWAYDDSAAPSPATSLRDRWVDIAQVVPPDLLGGKAELVEASAGTMQKFEPLVTPTRVVLIFLGVVLTIVVIELVHRSTVRESERQ